MPVKKFSDEELMRILSIDSGTLALLQKKPA